MERLTNENGFCLDCDYIAIISNEEEYLSLKNNTYAEQVTPYYYFSANVDDKSSSNLYVLESFEDLNHTTFNNNLLLKESNRDVENQLYIDEEAQGR